MCNICANYVLNASHYQSAKIFTAYCIVNAHDKYSPALSAMQVHEMLCVLVLRMLASQTHARSRQNA